MEGSAGQGYCHRQIRLTGLRGGTKINGRKRQLITDCLGLLLDVLVTPASTADRDAARTMLPNLPERFRELRMARADGGYTGPSRRLGRPGTRPPS
ncbi:transposase [Streptomyces sp. NPDC055898]|uniref:transposase n=1 Tax=Streptomyces sp. NPDC058258 TaxID=3346410 RepID=UPI0036E6D7BF